MAKKNSPIRDLTEALNAVTALNAAKAADPTEVQKAVSVELKAAKDQNDGIDSIVSAFKTAGMTDDAIKLLLDNAGLKKIDIKAEEDRLTSEISARMSAQKTEQLYNGLGEVFGMIQLMNEMTNTNTNVYAQPQQVQPPTIVVVPESPTVPQAPVTTAAAPTPTQWNRHCEVTRDIRAERYELERRFKNGEISFSEYVKLKASLNMDAFAQHCSVTATKKR